MNARRLERVVKGFASHRRIQVLGLLAKQPELSLREIAELLGTEFRNASVHVGKMAVAGLVLKRYEGRAVRHRLTDRGRRVLKFLKQLR